MHTVPLLTLWVNVERTSEKPLVNFSNLYAAFILWRTIEHLTPAVHLDSLDNQKKTKKIVA